jgi:hypothetical protein
VLPLSQGEIAGVREDFVEVLLSDPGLTEDKLGASTASALTEFGHLLETFVVGDVSSSSTGSMSPSLAGTGAHTTATRSTWCSNAKTARSPRWRPRPPHASPLAI